MSRNKLTGIIVVSIMGVIVLVITATSCTLSLTQFTLTTDVIPSGAGSVSPAGGEYSPSAEVTLTAIPASGYTFDHWSGDASGNTSTITLTMNSDKSLTVHFKTTSTVPDVLFSDDFSDEVGLWNTFSDAFGSVFYENGWLHLVDYTDDWSTLTRTHQDFTDFILEVETKFVGGTADNWHYVACRYQDGQNCYEFRISADGYYAMVRFINGNGTYLVKAAPSSYINQGVAAVNLIHIECIGTNLNLSVNGHVLRTVTDTALSSGDIALGAQSLAGNSTEIAFDNIIVTETAGFGPKSTPMVSAGWSHTVGLKFDGTVAAVGDNEYRQCDVAGWTDIIQVTAGVGHTVGLKSDGTVVAVGDNAAGQCDVVGWTGITQVAVGGWVGTDDAGSHTVGLKADGTVVAVGDNEYRQCDVADWTGIAQVAAGVQHTVGLKADGTVVAVGRNDTGQCDVADWTGIVKVAAGLGHTVGLRIDATVVAVGWNEYGQCNIGGWDLN